VAPDCSPFYVGKELNFFLPSENYLVESQPIQRKGRYQMKRMLTVVVSALVAVSFAGIVCAAEPSAAPAGMPPGHPPINKPVEKKAEPKKKKAAKKAKKEVKKDEAAAPATPATPAAPAKK